MYSKLTPVACALFFIFFLTSHVGNCVEPFQNDADADEPCTIGIPQKASLDCQKSREKELANQKLVLQYESKKFPPGLNMSALDVYRYFLRDTFNGNHTKLFVFMTKIKNMGLRKQWLQNHPLDVTRFNTYYDIFNFFRAGQSLPFKYQKFFRLVSKHEPFVDVINNWEYDFMFAEQRVAGNNPMSIRRVVTDIENVGIKWSELRKVLNPSFNWKAAIKRASKRRTFTEALCQGAVYALRYELLDGLKSMPDINESKPYRHMRSIKSPIGLFVVRRNKLQPVAIQLDFKQNSTVYTPRSRQSKWLLAKLTLQQIDGYFGQVVEHLVKIHQIVEPFCVCMHRHLSKKHPLNQLLKYHCRGTMVVNAIGGPTLITEGNFIHQMYVAGYLGTIELAKRKRRVLTWKEVDFLKDLKRRGVADKRTLSYYPFRDDGRVIYKVISRMVNDYVNLYYKDGCDISNDSELQAFANEISADGVGPDGGNGMIKDFPSRITSKKMLKDTITRLIWLASGQHAAVNYPTSDYSALATCVPTKLYNDDRNPPGSFSVLNFANAYIATTQALVAMNIGVLRYDRLFDYGAELEDRRAAKIVQKYYQYLEKKVSPLLERRNRNRLHNQHLTYPYLIPRWIPNSIQS